MSVIQKLATFQGRRDEKPNEQLGAQIVKNNDKPAIKELIDGLDDKNRRILIGWMGLPEIDYPSDKNQWAHCLTLPRELQLVNGRLIQKPVKELEQLRGEKLEFS